MDNQSVKEVLVGLAAAAPFIAAILWEYRRNRKREQSVLRNWAEENGLAILRAQERYLFGTGPFLSWNILAKQPVYYVKVRDNAGQERSGWVRLGCKWGALRQGDRKTEARWDESA